VQDGILNPAEESNDRIGYRREPRADFMNVLSPNVIRISTDDFPEKRRLAGICEVYGRTILKHDIEPVGDRPFAFNATLYRLPGLGLASVALGPCRAPRGPQHIENDDLGFNISFSGGRLVQQRGREGVVRQGEAILTTAGDPGVVLIPAPSHVISLRIPRLVMSTKGVDLDRNLVRRIPRSVEALSLLSGYLNTIQRAGALTSPTLYDAVVAHIHDLVALSLGVNGDARRAAEAGGMQAARLSAILRLIERRSGEPDLSAVTVATVLGVTPRYVHFLLEETGRSFTHHVLEQRLKNVMAMLREAGRRNSRIADIALEAGFGDLSSFNREFRRRYGMTPRDAREAAFGSRFGAN
jgi:AraC-like DNA-binding protein